MNRLENPRRGGEAKIRYLDGDFQILTPGSHVTCAMTGETIPVDELRYWSVARQEAYASCAASSAPVAHPASRVRSSAVHSSGDPIRVEQ